MTNSGQKTAVVMGVANSRSIASAIAQELREKNVRLALSYLDDGKGGLANA